MDGAALVSALQFVAERFRPFFVTPIAMRDHITVAIILGITLVLDLLRRRQTSSPYAARGFRVDLIYYFFYYGGIYHLFVFSPLYTVMRKAMQTWTPFLMLNLLQHMNPVMQVVAFVVVADVLGYWLHRWSHTNAHLWELHKIHHSQTRLTPLTNYRFHFLDETFRRVLLFIPFQMLGTSLEVALTVNFIMAWLLLLQHSELDWHYGPLGRVFVSPIFHQWHHSTAAEDQQSNYGMLFTFWDDLFGTARRRVTQPAQMGLGDEVVPDSFVRQQLIPIFRLLDFRRRPAVATAPLVQPVQEA
jgi:sterol desaturase/sphingolipid hydroxylase (fatty acid hydroxylase superfamily)